MQVKTAFIRLEYQDKYIHDIRTKYLILYDTFFSEVTVVKLKLDIKNVDDRNELHNTNSAYYKQISKHLEEEVNSKFMSINSQVGYLFYMCPYRYVQ